MKSILTAAVATLGVFAAPALAQEMPKPGPAQTRLAYYAGTWKYEGTIKESSMGPGGKISATETCRWFEGGFHLVCRSEGMNPMGAVKAQGIMGYDPAAKTYTYYGITSQGDGFLARGTVTGKVWNWTAESSMEGTPMKFRATMTEQSPTSYSFKLETAVGGGDWVVLEEGKSTKQ